tara:strand:- start:1634 stop:2128 length:495 start_codon:yes stop_codon:yes gene_type:complete
MVYDFTNSENIYFDFWLKSEYFLNPPFMKLMIDDDVYFEDHVKKDTHLRFQKKCSFDDIHKIKILRSGKTNKDTKFLPDGSFESQMLTMERIKIDNIDLKNLISHRCVYTPIYPVQWATEQRNQGIQLSDTLNGTTALGHNGQWEFDFRSPVYKFLIDWIQNRL